MPAELDCVHPVDLQAYGGRLYRARRYAEALQAFNKALDLKQPDVISILDAKAQVLFKLFHFKTALHVGRQMITLDRRNPRGYLRTGKILQDFGSRELAIEIYDRGLKYVAPANSYRQSIMEQRQKLVDGRKDPFVVLPLEVAGMILEKLRFKEVVVLLRVSSGWTRVLESLPKLWKDMDFSAAKRSIRSRAITNYIRRSQGGLTHVSLTKITSGNQMAITQQISKVPSLQYLSLQYELQGVCFYSAVEYARNLKTLIISEKCCMTLDSAVRILVHLKNLERAEFHNVYYVRNLPQWEVQMPNLRVLLLKRSDKAQAMMSLKLNDLLSRMSNLEELSVLNWIPTYQLLPEFEKKLPKLRSLDLSGTVLQRFPKLCPSIEYLNLSHVVVTLPIVDPVLEDSTPYPKFPNLRTAIFCNCAQITLPILSLLFVRCEVRPTHLDLSATPHIQMLELKDLVVRGGWSEIKELHIGNKDADDTFLDFLLQYTPNLEVLDISWNRITGVTVGGLVRSKVPLRKLTITGCPVAIDAADFARRSGVEVKYGFRAADTGRRVRYAA